MYKNALKEDLIRVVQELDGTVESTDTIVKLKTKIENSSTFESDPDFVKTLIQNCIDERVSQNEREETATHIGIREAEDWFRPIDLAKECDIYISSRSGSHKEIPITYGYTQDPFKNRSQNFKPKRMVEVKPINISLNQHSPSLSVGTAISPTLTEEFIIHPSVYSEIEKLDHAKSDVLLNESESSLGAHAYAYSSAIPFPNVSVSSVIENSSYDLPHVKNFNTRNDSSSLIKDYKCNKIKITKLKLSIPWQWKRRKKRNRFEQTSRTLQRKISMRSTKDQLVEKVVLMPVKNNVFLWNLPDVEEVPSHDGETV
ncbi:hypothetical protein TNCV_1524111 [Trichonephila clavipes]|nr:hypothetical protein TNCV_1524111 [Trichonephila clavipes]